LATSAPLSLPSGTDLAAACLEGGIQVTAAPWFAFRLRANFERSVAAALQTRGISAFLPSYSEQVRWSDRFKTVERLLYPGYLFVRCDLAALPQVLSLSGVLSVLDSNIKPCSIPAQEIENVKRVLESPLSVMPAAPAVGERVTVIRGPLEGASGVVVREGRKATLVVSISMMGRGVAVEVNPRDLEKEKTN
jgi:transcription termination/antitermination protein NusG